MPRPRILVIDDNPLVREVLALELTERGYDVHAEPDGPSGIASARLIEPAVVVLDLQLPGLGGSHVLQAINELYPALAVFLFTVYGDLPERVNLPGLAGCFVKSANLTPLIQAIGRVTGREESVAAEDGLSL